MTHRSFSSLLQKISIFGFLLLSSSYLLLLLVNFQDTTKINLGAASEFPSFISNSEKLFFLNRLSSYLDEQFPARNLITSIYYKSQYFVLQERTIAGVLIGEDGWLFLHRPLTWDSIQNRHLFSELQLLTILDRFQELDKMISEGGGELFVFIAPDKPIIYRDQYPASPPLLAPESVVEQVLSLNESYEQPLAIHYLGPSLLAAKDQGQVFFNTDTHWNSFGANVAFSEIMEIMNSHEMQSRFEDLTYTESSGDFSGGLTHMVGATDLFTESAETLFINNGLAEIIATNQHCEGIDLHQSSIPNLPSGLFFHDSFGNALKPYFSEVFSNMLNITVRACPIDINDIMLNIIRDDQPDYVILVFVERGFIYRLDAFAQMIN